MKAVFLTWILCSSFMTAQTRLTSGPISGSVPSGEPESGVLKLTLQDAIQRGLKQNLALVLGDQNTRIARAAEGSVRSQLRPLITGRITDSEQQVDLAAYGFKIKDSPNVIGPFNVFDARAVLQQSIYNRRTIQNLRASESNTKAAELSYRDSRDTVVQVVAAGYLQVVADQARMDEARSQVATAQALFNKAQDMLKAGLTPALDALRAQVELQLEQTRLRSLENDFAKDKLALARLIGLPMRQQMELVDKAPYSDLAAPDEGTAFQEALKSRSDFQAAQERLKAAEATRRAAIALRYPSVELNADFGDIGVSPWNSHGTFNASIGVRFPIMENGRLKAELQQADAQIRQRQAEIADLRGRIEYDIQSALLDLSTAADQLKTATSSVDLARQALTQSQDRFGAGVADNIEVVQAQNALATATAGYINDVYAHNLAKVSLARALGIAGEGVAQFLGGKQ